MTDRETRRFWLAHLLPPAVIAAVLLVIFESTDWDLVLEDSFFDPVRGRFPWRRRWVTEELLHDGVKWLVVVSALSCIALWIAARASTRLAPHRRRFGYLALCLLLCPLVVGGIKAASKQHCPWDLERYGGFAPYVRLLEPAVPGLERGACWPSGHASGPFALFGLYFLARRQPRRARLILAAVILGVTAVGFGRVMQGAHFVSHLLFSGVFCWCVCLVLYAACGGDRRFGGPARQSLE